MPGVAVCPSTRWSEFPFSQEHERSLKRFLLPREKYRRYGYRTGKFSEEELLHKHEAYCKRCDAFALKPDGSLAYKQQLQCRIHPGKKQQQDQIWSCCRTTTIEYPGQPSGCRVFSRHDWTTNSALPQKFWDLHYTPQFKPSGQRKRARKAVSLDCEMATNRFDHPELIKLTLIDFFTKEVLIDDIVKPLVKIKNMITHIHGITYKDIISASNASTAILGRDAARQKIFEFVGPETMVFVHGGTNDFLCLRWLHPAIVDTQEIESRVKRIGDDELDDWLDDEGTGLEAMCRLITGIQIRSGRTKYGNGVHDSLEDAMACRELGIWYAGNLKGEVGVEDAKGEVNVQQAPTAIPAESMPNRLETDPPETDPPEPITSLSPLVKEGLQFWDCKVCNLKVPKVAEQVHRTEPSHLATLLMLVQQKGG
ncbi:hypothetical protein TWF970_005835 [Orbilia oligospora]|uniref:Exonuclease domain-containing protein n=1 Tax=Orbilia oligospora TaxID=2813651 RepID=A0A7C8VIT1_ORBOL|nr:hypothetical protein TWF970_005835 [Orbilia oligospora]